MKTTLSEAQLAEGLLAVPVFPLPGIVLFPRALLPLHVFEPRYRAMLADAVAGPGLIVMAMITEGAPDANGHPPIADVAWVGVVVERNALADGRSDILLHGRARVRLEELPFVPPYRRARATLLATLPGRAASDTDRMALVAAANAFGQELARRDPRHAFALPENTPTETLIDLCAHHLVASATVRQRALAELDLSARAELVTEELVLQTRELAPRGRGMLH